MTTAVQVQYRRGTATQVAAFTGAQGELVVDTTSNRLVVQDGTTAGGFPAAKLSEVVTAVAANGGNVVTQSGGVVTIAEPGGYLNKFRNGTMDIWQRGKSSLTATTSGAYTADGWIVLPSGASVTGAQAGGRLLTKSSLQITGASSVTDVIVKQRIEGFIAAAFCSQTVTVQAQIYNNTGASITPALTVKHAGSQDVWSSPSTDVSAVNLQPCPNGQWTGIAYTFSASASSYNGVEVSFDFGNSFSAGAKSIQITECDIRATPGAAIGLNSNPPPPELRPIPIELAFCQRYLPAYNAGSGATSYFGFGGAYSTTGMYALFSFATLARTAVTGVVVSSAAHFAATDGAAVQHTLGSMALSTGAPTGAVVLGGVAAGTPYTSGQASAIGSQNAAAQLLFTGAEL
jgi:hypothetical protein